MFLVQLFVYLARVYLCIFSLPLSVMGWLRFLIVALLDIAINFLEYFELFQLIENCKQLFLHADPKFCRMIIRDQLS